MHRYIKAVGAGQKRARDLSRDEARAAMGLLADGEARPEQVGAFLLSLRMKGEAADELAGFVEALHARTNVAGARAPAGTLDVDCHGDGHHGRATLLPAAACALAALGVPTLLRLQVVQPQQRHGLVESLAALGLDVERALDGPRAARALATVGVAAIDLPRYCPSLAQLVGLRPLFGVRTVAQTLMKLLDPLAADARVVGVFHAPYLPSTAAALAERAGPSLCVQALGGLPEAAAGKIVRVCRPGGSPETIDLRTVAANESEAAAARASWQPRALGPDGETVDATEGAIAGPPENRAALDGIAGPAERAAAAAAVLLHAARGIAPLAAAEQALAVLRDGRARAVAARLRDA